MKMQLAKKIIAAKNILHSKILGKRVPIIVSFSITNKCNLNCEYCNLEEKNQKELNTEQIFNIISKLRKKGTVWLSITGGEPLLRNDIGSIVNFANHNNIITSITTNGLLLREKFDDIKNIDQINISFDGTKQAHEKFRGKNYYKVLDAINIAKKSNKDLVLNCTLTKFNIKEINNIVDFALQNKVKVKFQPVNNQIYPKASITNIIPNIAEYRNAIDKIISIKTKHKKTIYNTIESLQYIKSWPQQRKLKKCWSTIAFVRIDPYGFLYPCPMMENKTQGINILEQNLNTAIQKLENTNCGYCWCTGTLEINNLMNLRKGALKQAITNLMR